MDLSELLGVTEPVSVTFMDHEFTAHVYTAGAQRTTFEERERLIPQGEELEEIPEANNGNQMMRFKSQSMWIKYLRHALPVMVRGVDMDGTAVLNAGAGFPENVNTFPDLLLVELGGAAMDKWNAANPTNGGEPPIGSQPEGNAKEQSLQVQTTTP